MKFFQNIFSHPSIVDVAIDLGTENLLISDKMQVLFNESTLVAENQNSRGSVERSFGNQAKEIEKSSSPQYQIIRPVQNGVITDIDKSSEFLERALRGIARKPRVLITHPLDISEIERKAFRVAAENAGASKVILIPEPVAFVAGICPTFRENEALMMVDVGAGISEAVLFSRGRVVSHSSTRVGGEDFLKALLSYAKRVRKFEISETAGLSILNKIAYERNEAFLKGINVLGKNMESGLPKPIAFEVHEIEKVLEPLFTQVVNTALSVLDGYPPDFSENILQEGVHFTGGASQYPRIKELLQEKTTIPVADDLQPLLGVARGEIQILHDRSLLEFLANEYD